MCGWALFNGVVHSGIYHWSRQEIWGQASTERRWKYLNNLTRKYEILLIIVYIAKTWEPNRIDPDSAETESQRHNFPKQIGLSPAARKTTGAELCFDRTRNSSHRRGREEKTGGVTTTLAQRHHIYLVGKRRISRVAIVWEEGTQRSRGMVLGERDVMGIPA